MGKVYSIQALRFIAAFLVLVGHSFIHANLKLGGLDNEAKFFGWIGGYSVMVFFAISGYVIVLSCQQITAPAFFAYRLTRIYLGYFLAIATMAAVKTAIFGGLPSIPRRAFTLLPLGDLSYPLWIEWSLVFEVFFYCLFAIAWIPRSNRVIQAAAAAWLVAIVVGGHFGLDQGSDRYTFLPAIFFNFHNIAFILGVFLYYTRGALRAEYILHMSIFAIGIGLASIILTSDNQLVLAGMSISSILVLSVALLIRNDGWLIQGLSRLGDYSYGVYLLHTALITILLAKADLTATPTIAVVIGIAGAASAGATAFGYLEFHGYHLAKTMLRAVLRPRRFEKEGGAPAPFRSSAVP